MWLCYQREPKVTQQVCQSRDPAVEQQMLLLQSFKTGKQTDFAQSYIYNQQDLTPKGSHSTLLLPGSL